MIVDDKGYVSCEGKHKHKNVWLVKHNNSKSGYCILFKNKSLTFPKKYVGKRIMLKVEVIKNDKR